MPTEPWPIVTVAGKDYYQVQTLTRIEVDPEGQVYYLIGTPQGGAGSVGPLVQGDPGKHTEFQETVDFTALAWDDPTPASASVIEVTPGSDTVSQVVKLAVALHEGEPGADGVTSISLASITGTAAYKKIPQVNSAATGFEYTSQKAGDVYRPASIVNTPSGNSGFTLCSVGVAAQPFDWRPQVSGYTVVTEDGGNNVRVDLLARLQVGATSAETSGNIVGRCPGVASTERLVFSEGVPPGSADGYDRVPSGSAATVYMRCERQSGTNWFTTSAATTRFSVRVQPVP